MHLQFDAQLKDICHKAELYKKSILITNNELYIYVYLCIIVILLRTIYIITFRYTFQKYSNVR